MNNAIQGSYFAKCGKHMADRDVHSQNTVPGYRRSMSDEKDA